jgi:general secretion pathway protein L
MTESVLLRPVLLPDVWEVARIAADAGKNAYRGSPPDVARRCLQRHVVLIIPGADVTLHRVQVPARSAAEIRMAVPYALEEQLASKIEGLHFAVGAKAADGTVPVAVISHEVLQRYLDPLKQVGVQPASVIPEQLALPWREGVQSVLIDGSHAVVRTSASEGYAIEANLLPQIVRRAGDNNRPVQLWYDAESAEATKVAAGTAAENPDVEQRRLAGLPVALYAETLQAMPSGIEILQGGHRPDQESGLKSWRVTVGLLAASLLLHVGWSLWDLMSLKREVTSLSARGEEVFKNTFPEIKRVVNIESQADQELHKLVSVSGAADFVNLYAHVGGVLKAMPQVVVDAFAFKNGELILSVVAPDAKALQSLVDPLASASGAHVTLQDQQSGANGVAAKLLVGASVK